MHDNGIFSGEVAERYDADSAEMLTPEVLGPTVDFLADLAGDGRALELAIGTGRVALPLAERGSRVAGIEISQDMVAELRKKPGGGDIEVVIGDMTTATVNGDFRLVYLVFNTIGNLNDQQAQVECFRNAARHLEPGGSFVIEVGVPNPEPGAPGNVFAATDDYWGIDTYDQVTQKAVSHHFRLVDGEARYFACPYRYVWPAELDLMAQLAGMTLRERWASWSREPFMADSTGHVSVWEKTLS